MIDTTNGRLTPGENGLPTTALRADDGASAIIYLHGAHVTSWIPTSGGERLFLSRRSHFESTIAIRGGIPVIFPQFAAMGPLPKHGFARTAEWELIDTSRTTAGAASATLRLTSSPTTMAIWPRSFIADLTVVVHGGRLDVTLAVTNTDRVPFTFTGALHTYLRVEDARETIITGLSGLTYRDSAAGITRPDDSSQLTLGDAIDRIYLDAPNAIEVREPARGMRIDMQGFRDVVVWNPGAEAGAALADLEVNGCRRMICVEAAVAAHPITVAPDSTWTGQQRLETV